MSTATIESLPKSAEVLRVINPATEELLEEIRCSTPNDFQAAIEHAQCAYKSWCLNEACRRNALKRCAAVLQKRAHTFELAKILTQEQGKPKKEALNEVYAAAHWFAAMADIKFPTEEFPTRSGHAKIRYEPFGVVGAITSWNFPVFLAAVKIASALLPGNTILIKPSPYTPLSTIRLVELLTQAESNGDSALPKGAVTVLSGDYELGKWLVESPNVAHVSFTGSVNVGRDILRASAEMMKPVTLELGGNDAAIVLADAPLEQIVEPLFWGAFTNAGQFCTGIKRLYVHESLYEQTVTKMAERANRTIVGDGLNPKTEMGPLCHEGQYKRIAQLIDGVRKTGTIVSGGERLGEAGYFYLPTIVTDVSEGDEIVDEEQFGPLLPILPFRDIDEVMSRANSTNFGLGASIWTRDEQLAADLASRLDCGTVWINQHGSLDPLVPFGGRKRSGWGYENGWAGISEFTKIKVVHEQAGTFIPTV